MINTETFRLHVEVQSFSFNNREIVQEEPGRHLRYFRLHKAFIVHQQDSSSQIHGDTDQVCVGGGGPTVCSADQ